MSMHQTVEVSGDQWQATLRLEGGTLTTARASTDGESFVSIGDNRVLAWFTDDQGRRWAWAIDRTGTPRTYLKGATGDFIAAPYLHDDGTYTWPAGSR